MSDPRIYGFPPVQFQDLSGSGRSAKANEEQGKSFVDSLVDGINKVEKTQQDADQAVTDLATGRRKTLHETMIAMEKADISFRMLMAVRNKLLAAYQEIARMSF